MKAYKDNELVVGEIYAPSEKSVARFKFVSSDAFILNFTAGGDTGSYVSTETGIFQFSPDDKLRWYQE